MAKVLFIEDDLTWQNILRKLLKTAGHEFEGAESFDSAMALLSGKSKFDVIVFDLVLRGEQENPFVWLDALIHGLSAKDIETPPIIIVTGLELSKHQIINTFSDYRGVLLGLYEKQTLDTKDFLKRIQDFSKLSPSRNKSRSFLQVIAYTLLAVILIGFVVGLLILGMSLIDDAETQRIFIQIVGTLIVVLVVFVLMFSQNTRVEDVIGSITKIWSK